MGCASSKVLKEQAILDDWELPPMSRSISMPAKSHGQMQLPNDYNHLVALTSSTYGILKADSLKPPEEVGGDQAGVEPVKEVLKRLNNLELSAESGPQSWMEVSNMLENLKPGLEKISIKAGNSGPTKKFGKEDTIDVGDLMDGLDEEVTSVPTPSKFATPAATKSSAPRKVKALDKAITFHTVEELDARLTVRKMHPQASVRHEQLGVGKENAKPSRYTPSKEDGAASKTARTGMGQSLTISASSSSLRPAPTGTRSATADSPKSSKTDTVASCIAINASADKNAPSQGSNKGSSTTLSASESNARKGPSSPSPLMLPPEEANGSLFDLHLLASYRKALKKLTADDWHAVEAQDVDSLFESASDGDSVQLDSRGLRSKQAASGPSTPVRDGKSEEKPSSSQASPAEARRKATTTTTTTSPAKAVGNAAEEAAPQQPKEDALPKKVAAAADPLLLESFEKLCPPGGEKSVVLYTTSLRGIRKTYEDCNRVKAILESFEVSIDERDVSMHLEFRNELREVIGKPTSVPRLFIKGRYIGGAEEASRLHEEGVLVELLEGLPASSHTFGRNCDGCGGARFVPCLECSGSCKVVSEEDGRTLVRCPQCNENGLIKCPICS